MPQRAPPLIGGTHHCRVGINVQVAQAHPLGLERPILLHEGLTELSNDLATCSAQPNDEMVLHRTPSA